MRQQIQQFGRTLSGMVMPNIGAFIAWGFITALFIPEGWWPNGQLAQLVGPMLTYLLPLLIAYTAGRNVAGERGGVIGAIAAVGVIVGSDIPMFIGAMIMGPLAGYAIRRFDRMVEGRVKAGFEMLVSNFSIGILGMLLAVLGYYVVGSVVSGLTMLISSGAELVIRHGLLPLVSLFVEPAKVLFLNNATESSRRSASNRPAKRGSRSCSCSKPTPVPDWAYCSHTGFSAGEMRASRLREP